MTTHRKIAVARLVLTLLLVPAPAAAQEPKPALHGGRTSAAIRVDGILDEPAWREAGTIPDLTQQSPSPGGSTPFRTEVRVLFAGDAIYIGARCFDPDPSRIAIHTMQRDDPMEGDDHLSLLIDTFGDRTTGYLFLVNAAGARSDGLIAGPQEASFDWDGVWVAKTTLDDQAWTVEIMIPTRTLRFNASLQSWGFNVQRYVARDQITLRWSGTSLDSKLYDLRRAGDLTGVAGLRQGPGIAVKPYALARAEKDRPADQSGSSADAGVDTAWSITPSLQAVLTVNTDFAETEADTRQINLTRFPLLYPEKRAFFLEGSNQFEFGLGLSEDFIPFFSRRIGLFGREQVPLIGGVKVIGQQGPFGIAALGVRTDSTSPAPGTGLYAARITYDAGAHMRLGAIGTEGNPDGEHDNNLAGVDATFRTSTFLGDKNFLVGVWGARTGGDPPRPDPSASTIRPPVFQIPSPPEGEEGPGRRSGWGFKIDYPNDLWDCMVSYRDVGDALDPALGFLPRPGVRAVTAGAAFQPRPRDGWWATWVRQFFFEAFVTRAEGLDGRTQSRELFLSPFMAITQSGDRLEAMLTPRYEALDAPFEIVDGIVIPQGEYAFTRYRLEAGSSEHRPWQVITEVEFGPFYSGHLTQIESYAQYTTRSGHLQIGVENETDLGNLPEGDFTLRMFQMKAVYAFKPDLVLDAFAQYDSESRDVGLNARFRWTFRPGADFFVVWNRNWFREPGASLAQIAPQGDQVVVKVRYTWWP